MDTYRYIRHWVEDLPKIGLHSFTLAEAEKQFPYMQKASVLNALHRLSCAGKIRSVWRGFYAIVLPEYGILGDVPPVEYINQLMAYIKADYYVALLSAASYQGASHQSSQVFQVIAGRQIRQKEASGSRLEFSYKKKMPQSCIERKTVKSGYINVSKPALTALDLVAYPARSGGISNLASVLLELADSIDFSVLDSTLLKSQRQTTVQRLGYLFENVIDEKDLAEELYEKSDQAGIKFLRSELVTGIQERQISFDGKWKISVNYKVEVDG